MTSPILVVGLSDAGPAGLPEHLVVRIRRATLLAGGRRHLGWFPDAGRERIPITGDIEGLVARLRATQARGEAAVVLASGDPLWFGIGATLRRYFDPALLEIRPAPSAAQLAFAALGEPWAGAALLSAHARSLEEVVRGCATAPRAAILTDSTHTPAVIARALLDAGHPPERPTAVCESLGGAEQRVWRGTLAGATGQVAGPLNVFVLLPGEPAGRDTNRPQPPLSDCAFCHQANLITKQEIRTLALARLRPHGALLWDIGAGCGAVGIEAILSGARAVWAVEKNPTGCAHIRENVERFGVNPHYHLVHGRAPQGLADWPAPDGIFIGGSGGTLAPLLRASWDRLVPGGRLVATFATIENLATAAETLKGMAVEAEIIQASIARSRAILDMTRFEALNPVWIISAVKEVRDAG